MKKLDAKPRLIRWIILLQEFHIEIKHKSGAKNVVADHLSTLYELPTDPLSIRDDFPYVYFFLVHSTDEPWYANIVNFLVASELPACQNKHQLNKRKSEAKYYVWGYPYLVVIR